MTKTYHSKTVFSFSITLPHGKYKRIRFLPYSPGGGIYITKDPVVQSLLEADKEYGKTYELVSVEGQEETIEETEEPKKEPELRQVEVNDLDEAKDYLNENCGVPKRNMRSGVAIRNAAAEKGIVFKGI